MGWENVDNKHKKAIDSEFVSCEEEYEITYLVKFITEEYDWITEADIRKAIALCCLKIDAPRPRDEFLRCLKHNLGVE